MSHPNRPLDTRSRKLSEKYGHLLTGKYWQRYWYRLTTRLTRDDLVFFNWGYEEEPPMALALSESDEPDRYFIQLYHRVATQKDLAGKQVLEVGCGHGGGASYLARTLDPASYTGMDLNPDGIEFCRKRHKVPNLNFIQGDAQNLPFADNSFDAVINVESSHCYPDLPRFLAEVARVLRSGGHFLYADVRPRNRIAEWEADLRNAPMRLVSESSINEQVARGVERNLPWLQKTNPHQPRFFVAWTFNNIRRQLQNDGVSYRVYAFVKE